MNSLLFVREQAKQTVSPIAMNIKGSFIQPSTQNTGWEAWTFVSSLLFLNSQAASPQGKGLALCSSRSPFGDVPFFFQWMFGKGTGIQFFFPIPGEYFELCQTFFCWSSPHGKQFQQEEFRAMYTTFPHSTLSRGILLSSLCEHSMLLKRRRYRDNFRNQNELFCLRHTGGQVTNAHPENAHGAKPVR